MPFSSTSQTFFGQGYSGEAHTVQDFDLDAFGNYIYAVGTLNIIHSSPVIGGARAETLQFDNRGLQRAGVTKSYAPPFYTQADATACLTNLVQKMHFIGRQG